ncbi:MAG TPA: hypothetical protein VKU19_00790 [Bryobacteraceae bacterium]|nr:hypothetical protein [Bryobacteraceae bacterium]
MALTIVEILRMKAMAAGARLALALRVESEGEASSSDNGLPANQSSQQQILRLQHHVEEYLSSVEAWHAAIERTPGQNTDENPELHP